MIALLFIDITFTHHFQQPFSITYSSTQTNKIITLMFYVNRHAYYLYLDTDIIITIKHSTSLHFRRLSFSLSLSCSRLVSVSFVFGVLVLRNHWGCHFYSKYAVSMCVCVYAYVFVCAHHAYSVQEDKWHSLWAFKMQTTRKQQRQPHQLRP